MSLRELPGAAYALDVTSGQIVAGRMLRLGCQRHLRDLERYGTSRGGPFWFDPSSAAYAIDFIESFCRHYKGSRWAGELIRLAPWQIFLVANLFGWRRSDGTRKYRRAYIQVAKKNGKSTLMGAIGLYMLTSDQEPGAEVYSTATTKAQAKEVWGAASKMVKKEASLRRRIRTFKNALTFEEADATFRPITSSADTEDGASPSCSIADELHRWPDRDLFDLLDSASAARMQPLFIAITTAGARREGVCWEERVYAQQVLEETFPFPDEAHFALIFEPDEGDEWDTETAWRKANPSLGESILLSEMEEKAVKARNRPSAVLAFKRYRCNIWTDAAKAWLPAAEWQACEGGPPLEKWAPSADLVVGLDLSKTRDWTAAAVLLPPSEQGEAYRVAFKYFLPGDDLDEREKHLRIPLQALAEAGWIELTDGNRTDQEAVATWLKSLAATHEIKRVPYDPTGAWKLSAELQKDGLPMVEIQQSMRTLGPALLEAEDLIVNRRILHDGNPITAWMFGNVELEEDAGGNRRPSRSKSRSKIDGIVALIMAVYEAIKMEAGGDEGDSIYNRRGLITS